MNSEERYIKITELLKKFKNGEELYNKNALFNKVIHMMINDIDVYRVIEELVLACDVTNKSFEDYINRDTRPVQLRDGRIFEYKRPDDLK